MKYIKQYYNETGYSILYQDEFETKFVPDGENSPKVIEWLKSNTFEIIPYEEPDLKEYQDNIIKEIKTFANQELLKTDYKINRQLEQIQLGIETTLNEKEYNQLLIERQSIREKSNDIENQILKAETVKLSEEIFKKSGFNTFGIIG